MPMSLLFLVALQSPSVTPVARYEIVHTETVGGGTRVGVTSYAVVVDRDTGNLWNCTAAIDVTRPPWRIRCDRMRFSSGSRPPAEFPFHVRWGNYPSGDSPQSGTVQNGFIWVLSQSGKISVCNTIPATCAPDLGLQLTP